MPLYVFACAACGDRFERILSMDSRDTDRRCGRCGALVARQVTSASWQLGSGPPESAVSKAIARVKARGL